MAVRETEADTVAGQILTGFQGHAPMRSDEVREFCLSLPEVTEKLQWEDALCFKIGGKMFAVLGLDNPRLSFKCTPEVFAELIEQEDIHPSPYLGRHKWVKLDRLDALADDELRGLISQSYEIVHAKQAGARKKRAGLVRRRPKRESTGSARREKPKNKR